MIRPVATQGYDYSTKTSFLDLDFQKIVWILVSKSIRDDNEFELHFVLTTILCQT